ncbi:MAG: ABC transporter ATP-binding protein [Candidatus Kapaibacterium sp.]
MNDNETEQISEGGKKRSFKLSSEGIQFLIGYLKPYRGKFTLAMVALLFSSLSGLAFPGFIGALIDVVQTPGNGIFGSLNSLSLFLLGIVIAQAGFSFIRTYVLQDVSERSLADLRGDLYSHIVNLQLDFFHRNRVGDLTSRLGSDITAIQTTMTTTLSELIRQTIILLGGISLVIYTSPRLTLVILGALPLVVAMAVGFGRVIRKSSKRVQDLYAELNTIAEETFQAITVVKAFTAELRERKRFGTKLDGIIEVSLKVARTRAAFIAFVVFLLFGGVVGVIWYGGTLVQSGELTIGELTSFVLYAAFVGGAMGSFADLYGGLQRALGSAERIREILDEKPELSELESSGRVDDYRGEIRFSNVSFSYPTRPEAKVLDNISFTIPPGTSLAVVGPSGSGKTTLTNLLLRFYPPDNGSILIDGKESLEIPLNRFREMIAIVPQEVILFGGTIRENILYGKPEASEADVIEAANAANALEFIESFNDGFETIVGERGIQLSGGQRQRIAIARAILRNPKVLILDEATSALDTESERLVQEALQRVMQNRTTMVIAHRLSTVRNVDQVAVLQKGKIVELGGYDELIAHNGLFARMIAMQRDGEIGEFG